MGSWASITLEIISIFSFPAKGHKSLSTLLFPGHAGLGFALTEMWFHVWLQNTVKESQVIWTCGWFGWEVTPIVSSLCALGSQLVALFGEIWEVCLAWGSASLGKELESLDPQPLPLLCFQMCALGFLCLLPVAYCHAALLLWTIVPWNHISQNTRCSITAAEEKLIQDPWENSTLVRPFD